MTVFSLLMFGVGAVFLWLGIQIAGGKTNWIHDYHQRKVKDKASYGKSFGRAMTVMAVGFFCSGGVGLLGETFAPWALSLLAASLILGIGWIIAVQKKYNQGIF